MWVFTRGFRILNNKPQPLTPREMTTRKLANLMMRSSATNPYSGKLSKKGNILAAIELAKLAKDFADKGQTDEAMDIESSQWVEVISKLETFNTKEK